jgi:hypothetical protein
MIYVAHAYSVLKAVEFHGKKFVKIRNPWGKSEWTGRWSDGSREWEGEWINALKPLGHSFGDDVNSSYTRIGAVTDAADTCRVFSSWNIVISWNVLRLLRGLSSLTRVGYRARIG